MSQIMMMTEEPKVIDIFVECEWILRSDEMTKKNITGRKYEGKFHGGYTIVKCPGFPSINGGFGTPDMMASYPTEQSIKDRLFNQHSERYPEHQITVHLKVIKDDRNPTMDNFF